MWLGVDVRVVTSQRRLLVLGPRLVFALFVSLYFLFV